MSQELKVVESSNLVKLVFRFVKYFWEKIKQKYFRLDWSFKRDNTRRHTQKLTIANYLPTKLPLYNQNQQMHKNQYEK